MIGARLQVCLEAGCGEVARIRARTRVRSASEEIGNGRSQAASAARLEATLRELRQLRPTRGAIRGVLHHPVRFLPFKSSGGEKAEASSIPEMKKGHAPRLTHSRLHSGQGPVQRALHRAQTDTQSRGDLVEGKIGEVAQGHHRALPFIECLQSPFEVPPGVLGMEIVDRPALSAGRHVLKIFGRDADLMVAATLLLPVPVDGRVDRHPGEPGPDFGAGVDARAIAETV